MNTKRHCNKRLRSLLVTAGPTREAIDPVRFISNHSTGIFGYEIAKEGKRRGLKVTLITGPTTLKAPAGIRVIKIESALEMLRAVKKEVLKHDCLIMAAAVSDWRVKSPGKSKIKKGLGKKILELVENPDILREIGANNRRISVGFALETENKELNALKKLQEKGLDIIVANTHKKKKTAFGNIYTSITIIDRHGSKLRVANKSKAQMAKIILDKVESFNI